MLLFAAGLAFALVAGVVALQDTGLANGEMPEPAIWVAVLGIPIIAGQVTLLIPGRLARGGVQSAGLAFIGWMAVGLALYVAHGWLLTSISSPRGAVEQALAALVGAALIRVALLVIS
jgi:hypothetical protein